MQFIPTRFRNFLIRHLTGAEPSTYAVRGYDSARRTRLNNDWRTYTASTNWELRSSLRTLRNQSRDLARNNDLAKKWLSMVRTNVAGPFGMTLQVRARDGAGKLDATLNKIVEQSFEEWCKPENCSASGTMSFRDYQRRWITHVARDGEALFQKVVADNKFAFALKSWDVSWLDETFSESSGRGGNRIIMSVELDANDKPVAFWLTPPASEFMHVAKEQQRRTRYDAAIMLHDFLRDDENTDHENQVRGVPHNHTIGQRLRMLHGYEESELVAARISASKMGFYEKPASDSQYAGPGEDSKGSGAPDNIEPGQFTELEPGWEFKSYDPQHPTTAFDPFHKKVTSMIAAGVNVAYFSLAGDYGEVNFTSGRLGLQAERDEWQALQQFQIDHFCRPVFLSWLDSAVMAGALQITSEQLERVRRDSYFQPRGWQWIQPIDEINAAKEEVALGLNTRTDIAASQGRSFPEMVEILREEKEILEAAGLYVEPESKVLVSTEDPKANANLNGNKKPEKVAAKS